MAKVTYVGPHDAVDVIHDGAVVGTVERGGSIDVSSELAERLLEQDVWEPFEPKRERRTKEVR